MQALFTVAESSISRTMAAAMPKGSQAVLLMVNSPTSFRSDALELLCSRCDYDQNSSSQDDVGVVVNARGEPAAASLTFPVAPSALAFAGGFCMAANSSSVYIFDLSTSELVQTIEFPPSFQQPIQQQLLTARDAQGSCILIAGFRRVGFYIHMPILLGIRTCNLTAELCHRCGFTIQSHRRTRSSSCLQYATIRAQRSCSIRQMGLVLSGSV